jgi:hypothetical protein
MIILIKGIKSMVSGIKEIASLFSSTSTTKIIGEDCCTGFDQFAMDTSSQTINCLCT